jgi:hypothetical protein
MKWNLYSALTNALGDLTFLVRDDGETLDENQIKTMAFTKLESLLGVHFPRKYIGKTTAPTTGDDSADGYAVGDRWVDETNDKEYVALDVSVGAAVWTETTGAGGAGASFWTTMAGTPTRISNTTFTVTGDVTASSPIAKGMIIKWTESGSIKLGMVSIPPTYSAPNSTITIIGDTMASIDAASLKYATVDPLHLIFPVAGTIGATGTDVAPAWYAKEPYRVLGADIEVGTAGTTNNTTADINKGGTTMFTTKPTLATTVAASPTPFTADSGTSLALNDKVTIDIDAIQTTAAIDLYVTLYIFPTRYLYLT